MCLATYCLPSPWARPSTLSGELGRKTNKEYLVVQNIHTKPLKGVAELHLLKVAVSVGRRTLRTQRKRNDP